MNYPIKGIYGIPGGHVEHKEQPDDAMKRELLEELSLSIDSMKRTDFFRVKRIILGYTAIAPSDIVITSPNPKFEYGEWVTKDELETIDIAQEYRRFIIENWPN